MDAKAIPEELMEVLQELFERETRAYVLSAQDLEILASMDQRATHAGPETLQ
jgi:hypothetical protein